MGWHLFSRAAQTGLSGGKTRDSGVHSRQAAVLSGTDPDPAGLLGSPRLRDPAALRHGNGRGHLPHGHDLARAGTQALERSLCAALAPAEGWPLRRESQPDAALLPIPG